MSYRPLQSFPRQRSSGPIGLPSPGPALAPARALSPSGISSSARVQGSDSLNCPLLRFDPPLWFVPKSCPLPFQQGTPLMGFLSPTTHQAAGVHVLPPKRKTRQQYSKKQYQLLLKVPTPSATVPLSGFPNLSATLLLRRPSYRFQIGGVPGVVSFRGLLLLQSPNSSSLLAYPLDVAPKQLRCPSPRLRLSRARRPAPRISWLLRLFSPSGFSSLQKSTRLPGDV